MRCIYCNQPVTGPSGVTVARKGVAHRECYELELANQRVFKGLSISDLSDQELNDLIELALQERNQRNRGPQEDTDEIELF